MKKISIISLMSVLASLTIADQISITATNRDQGATIYATSNSMAYINQATARVGDTAAGLPMVYVIPFQLPSLTGGVVTNVSLELNAPTKAAFGSNLIYMDVVGLRVDSSPNVSTNNDPSMTGGMVVGDGVQLINSTVVVPLRGKYTLDASYFYSIYAGDPDAAGKFVFLMVRPDAVDPFASNSYLEFATADNTTVTNRPTLTITTGDAILPVANFSANPVAGDVPLQVVFNDTSTGTIENRYWDFGDGVTTNTTLTSLSHTYMSAGTFTVKLAVSGPAGVSTNIQSDLIAAVSDAPTANFSANLNSGAVPLAVSFTDTSTGSITNRFWNFGDGVTTNTTSTAIAHTYTVDGTFTVELIVGGPAGVSTNTQVDYITASLVVPTADFGVDKTNGYAPLTVTFTNLSSGSVTNSHWDFGDGVTTNTGSVSVQHIYSSTGFYTVGLTAIGPAGSNLCTKAGFIEVKDPSVYWTGAGADNHWNTGGNWDTGSQPAFGRTATFAGDAGAVSNPDVNGTTNLGISLNFKTAGWTISDSAGTGAIRVDGGMTISSDGVGVNHLDTGITASGSTVVRMTIGSGNTLRVSRGFLPNNIDFGASSGVLVFDGSVNQGSSVYSASPLTCPALMTILVNTVSPNIFSLSVAKIYGRLGGTGTLSGYQYQTSTIESGGVLAPGGNGEFGDEIGTMVFASASTNLRHSVSFETGSTFEVQLGANLGSNDKLVLNSYGGGYVNIKAGVTLNLLGGGAIQDGTYTIMENLATDMADIAGTFTAVNYNGSAVDTNKVTVSYLGDSITVTVVGLNGDGPLPPASTVTLGTRGAGQDVINWTTAQGSGFVYSVYYATNLLSGFLPLATDLPDTVNQWTNNINTSPVFYKIECR